MKSGFAKDWNTLSSFSLRGLRVACAILAMFLCGLSVPSGAYAASGRYVLVKTVIDRNKDSKSFPNSSSPGSVKMTANSFVSEFKILNNEGGVRFVITKKWSFTSPPSQFAPGQEATITASGSVSTTDPDGNAATRFDVGGDITQDAANALLLLQSAKNASGSRTFRLKAPAGPSVRKEFEINLAADGAVNDYYYEWREGAAAPPKSTLKARLDCGTLELVRNQTGESCHIVISGWRRDTANRVEVIFPKQSDGYGSQDKGGRTGIVVSIGQGSESPSNMSGSRGADGSYGKEYLWTLFVRARGNAPIGTQRIPITVRQTGGGEVKLYLPVRVLPGRTKQSGPRRDGEGATTGGTGSRPPITQAASATGLRARLSTGTLTLAPGQNSQTCTIFIKGWRGATSDQVEIVLPQESKPRGNLGNDLVAFPGGGAVDPANMTRNANGEYGYGIGFRAMERAPGVTTMIEIIVRQKGHQEVRLLLRIDVRGASTAKSRSGVSAPGRTNPGTTNSGKNNPGKTAPGNNGSGITIAGGSNFPFGGNEALDNASQLAEDGNLPQAETAYRNALRANPKLDEGWNGLGDVCRKQGKWSEAEKAFREAIRLQPGESYYHAQLAEVLLKQNKRDEAVKEAREAKRLGLEDHDVFYELGMVR